MPLYVYRCPTPGCGQEEEVWGKMGDVLRPVCPLCTGPEAVVFMQRVFTPPMLARDGTYSYRAGERKV